MPMYDYKCLDCGKESLVVLTLKEHESGKALCPLRQSQRMQQVDTSFIAHTTKNSRLLKTLVLTVQPNDCRRFEHTQGHPALL